MTGITTMIAPAELIFLAGHRYIKLNTTYPVDFLLDNLKIQTNVIETT